MEERDHSEKGNHLAILLASLNLFYPNNDFVLRTLSRGGGLEPPKCAPDNVEAFFFHLMNLLSFLPGDC
jgi:hypothetical protein